MPHLSRENLCKKQYCNVTKTNRFVLKILAKLNHFVLKVRTGGFADSRIRSQRTTINRESGVNPEQSRCCEAQFNVL